MFIGAGAVAIVFGLAAALYFLPLIIAILRKVPNVGSVAVINIMLGWTLIGWVVAMALAARSTTPVVPMYTPLPPSAPPVAPPNAFSSLSPPVPSAQYSPGWYPDPYRRARLRYYDGQVWTDHTSA